MVPLKRLYLVAGFDRADLEAQVSAVQRSFPAGDKRFIARPYPRQSDKRANYLADLVQQALRVIFGTDGATNFCRRQDQPCALDQFKGKQKPKTCQLAREAQSACARARPHLLVMICAQHLYDEVLDRLGRAILILPVADAESLDAAALRTYVDTFEPVAASVVAAVSNRSKSLYAPLIPDRNFQRLTGRSITAEAQADLTQFVATMERYHAALYRGDFQNPRKKSVRGAYMFNNDTAFQQDHLHKVVQQIGAESRADGFHLLNAYHLYGVKIDPGFHFDVMNIDGKAIGQVFTDILTGGETEAADTHINATPCDRIL